MKGQVGYFPGWMKGQLSCPSGLKRGCGGLSQWNKRSLEIGAIGICGHGILCWASLFSCSVFSSFSYKPSWTEDIFPPHLYVNPNKLFVFELNKNNTKCLRWTVSQRLMKGLLLQVQDEENSPTLKRLASSLLLWQFTCQYANIPWSRGLEVEAFTFKSRNNYIEGFPNIMLYGIRGRGGFSILG